MLDSRDIGGLQGAPLHGANNEKIGNVAQVFVDPETGSPNWVTIKTGFLGRHESFVPLANATWDGEVLRTDLDRETVLEAPRLNADEGLSPHNEEALNRYFGLSDVDTDGGTARPAEEYPDHPELMEQAAARQRADEATAADGSVDARVDTVDADTRPAVPASGATAAPGAAPRDTERIDSAPHDSARVVAAPGAGDADVRAAQRDTTVGDTAAGDTTAGDTADLDSPPRRTGPRHAATRDSTP